jgi:hypothetical protein
LNSGNIDLKILYTCVGDIGSSLLYDLRNSCGEITISIAVLNIKDSLGDLFATIIAKIISRNNAVPLLILSVPFADPE